MSHLKHKELKKYLDPGLKNPLRCTVFATVRDIFRGSDYQNIYLNNERLLPDDNMQGNNPSEDDKFACLELALQNKFAHKEIAEYIKTHLHQDGFLFAGMFIDAAIQLRHERQITISRQACRWDFITAENGDVIFIERYYIDGYMELQGDHKSEKFQFEQPIALCEITTRISQQHNKIMHTLLSDKTFILNEEARRFFNIDDYGIVEERLNDKMDSLDTEYLDNLKLLIDQPLYRELALESMRLKQQSLPVIDNKKLDTLLGLTKEVLLTPVDDNTYLTKANNLSVYTHTLKSSANFKIAVGILLAIVAVAIIAATIAALVLTFGGLAVPLAAGIAITALTVKGVIGASVGGLVVGLAASAGSAGLFAQSMHEHRTAKLSEDAADSHAKNLTSPNRT